jgi:hypothetical protein
VHGYARATLDIDFFINKDEKNIEKIIKALSKFGYDLQELTTEDFQSKKILIRQYVLEVDIHPFVKGVEFADLWKNKKESLIGMEKAYFASLDDLIKMKKAAGRSKDMEDLKFLLKIKKKLASQ